MRWLQQLRALYEFGYQPRRLRLLAGLIVLQWVAITGGLLAGGHELTWWVYLAGPLGGFGGTLIAWLLLS